MTIEESVQKINSLIPIKEKLIKAGHDEGLVDYDLKHSLIKEKKLIDKKDKTKLNQVFDFYQSYNIDNLSIGYWILFDKTPKQVDTYYLKFGSVEADYIICDTMNNKIYIIDCYSFEKVYLCADSFSNFLEALFYHSQLFWKEQLGFKITASQRCEVSSICAKTAALNYYESLDFYKFINGCL